MTNDIRILPLSEEDYKFIPHVYHRSFQEPPWEDNWYDFDGFNSKTMWVCKKEHHLIGFITSYLRREVPYISVVAVDRAYHRQGLATGIVHECLRYWCEAGYSEIGLDVATENSPARKLYESLGFKEVLTDDGYIYMKRQL